MSLRLVLIALGVSLAMGVSGCVYRMDIQQGNLLDAAAVSQLKEGMTRSQVRYLLGTPMVPDAFDGDRWDYLYFLKEGRLKSPEKRRLTVYFESDKVTRFEKEGAAIEDAKARAAKYAVKPKKSLWRRVFRRGEPDTMPLPTPSPSSTGPAATAPIAAPEPAPASSP